MLYYYITILHVILLYYYIACYIIILLYYMLYYYITCYITILLYYMLYYYITILHVTPIMIGIPMLILSSTPVSNEFSFLASSAEMVPPCQKQVCD